MFRDKPKNAMHKDHLGVGSIVKASVNWLIVGTDCGSVTLVNLKTFEACNKIVVVEDINYLTTGETRKLVELTKENWTLTDFDFDTKGFKNS